MRQFAVLGLGKFGQRVAQTLAELEMPVVAIDHDAKKIEAIGDIVSHAVRADATDKRALLSAGVGSTDVAVISLGDVLETSVLATILVKELGVKHIIVKGTSPEHGKVLELVGATQVVYPEEDMAERVAQKIINANVLDHIPLLPGYSIVEIIVPEDFDNKTILDLNLRRVYGVEILVIRTGEDIRVIPSAMDIVHHNDTLVIFGKDEDIDKLRAQI